MMVETSERNPDILAYLQAVKKNLSDRPCKNGRSKRRGGCIGCHDDCKNQVVLDKLNKKALIDPFFTEPVPPSVDASEALNRRIEKLQHEYEGKPPVFDEQEKVEAINVRHDHGNTPLHLAVESNNGSMAKDLIEQGADYSLKNNNGHTPFALSHLLGYSKMTRLLKRCGVEQ